MRPMTISSAFQQSFRLGAMAIAAVALVATGCASGTKVAQSTKGSVYLEEITDWSFEANHPAVIDQQTITKVMKGLYTDGSQSGASGMSAGGSKSMRIFSDEEAEFLSPLLAQGFSKAKPEQVVGFRIPSSAGSGSEPTTGSLYVQKGSIYVAIAKGPRASGFSPESVARAEEAPAYITGGILGSKAIAIDYHALAKAPMPAAIPIAKAAPKAEPSFTAAAAPAPAPMKSQPVMTTASQDMTKREFQPQSTPETSKAKETIAKKETEINMLRKESDWMKRELRERDEEIKALKASLKSAPKKKPAQVSHSR